MRKIAKLLPMRKFSGKVFLRESKTIRGYNKAEATHRASKLKAKGYLVRIVASGDPHNYGYMVWWRAERGHGY
jgi:precorrin-6B methylase 1